MNAIPLLVISGVTINDIGNKILGWFEDLGQAFINMIKAPFEAIASIFTSWGSSLGEWWGPILMAVVLVSTLLILYGGFKILDTFLN